MKFDYKSFDRVTVNGSRHYSVDGIALPSVTTILSKTSTKDDVLQQWRSRVGAVEADRITKLSADIGTLLHTHMECYLQNLERPIGNSYVRSRARIMADSMIENAGHNITEIWGIEVPLYFPGLYAGTTDLVGRWKGKPAIIDFKNTRKPKKREWILDYEIQIIAYALAHNELYGTDIKEGVILMVAREDHCVGEYQEFFIDEERFMEVKEIWLDKVSEFYKNHK